DLDRAGEMLLVHGLGRTASVEQIENIVIQAKSGVPIRVRDVADVAIGHEIRRGAVTATLRDSGDPEKLMQGEVVLGLGFMLMGQKSYDVTRRMRGEFYTVEDSLPPGGGVVTAYYRTPLFDSVVW